jgi:hypothetical protein
MLAGTRRSPPCGLTGRRGSPGPRRCSRTASWFRLDTGRAQGRGSGRDPQFALHSATVDPVEGFEAQWSGEAKISGRAIAAGLVTEGADGDRFHADIAEVVHTHLNQEATMLVVEWWTPGQRLRRVDGD